MKIPQPLPTGAFQTEALALFARQYEQIEVYGRYCDALEKTPANVTDWRTIPLMPTSSFRTYPLQTADALANPIARFETSGTTGERPGTVVLADLTHYNASLLATFAHYVVPDGNGPFRVVSLVPPPSIRPHSSLGHMAQVVAQRFSDGPMACHVVPGADLHGAVDGPGLLRSFANAVQSQTPVLVLATTIALDMALVATANDTLCLPAGSRIMDTGGSKGRAGVADRAEVLLRAEQQWGVVAAMCVGELGMTELGSQRYETTLRATVVGDVAPSRTYAGPPWLRSIVLDPATLTCRKAGEIGQIGHIDLANQQTCAFVLTSDLGCLRHVDGAGWTLDLAGRAPGSAQRGCSLDMTGVALPGS